MNDQGNFREVDRDSLLSTLAWWVEAGIDTLVDAEPRDWLCAPAEVAPASAPTASSLLPVSTLPETGTLAATANSIADLRQAVETFTSCPLRTPGVNTVFADGNPNADLMLIGEAPGAQEDRMGLPFVGPAGQLLDRMLAAIGRDRSSAYITNVTFWRPPGNRTPTQEEVATTFPFVLRHIALVRPKAIVALGAVASRALTGDAVGIMRMRGLWRTLDIDDVSYPVLPMLHPAFLLRQPDAKRLAWADLLSLKAKLDAD